MPLQLAWPLRKGKGAVEVLKSNWKDPVPVNPARSASEVKVSCCESVSVNGPQPATSDARIYGMDLADTQVLAYRVLSLSRPFRSSARAHSLCQRLAQGHMADRALLKEIFAEFVGRQRL